jgi:hypothetical protein
MKVRQLVYIFFAFFLTGMTLNFAPQPVSAQQCNYYASPDGKGDGLSESSPFQIGDFLSISESEIRGKSLCLLDGTYYEALNISKSGTASQPISIRALHDGEVTIDGQGSRIPVSISGNYIVVEGIVARKSSKYVWSITGDHNIIRRCSSYDGNYDINTGHGIAVMHASYNLIEDCIAAGTSRHVVMVYGPESTGNVVRRVFSRWDSHSDEGRAICNYGANHTTIENSIIWENAPSTDGGLCISANYERTAGGNDVNVLGSIILNGLSSYSCGLTITYPPSENSYIENCLIYNYTYGILISIDPPPNFTIKNSTIVNNDYGIRNTKSSGGTIKNTVFYNNDIGWQDSLSSDISYVNSFANSSGNTPPNCSQGCISVDPGFSPYPARLTIPPNSPMKGAGENGSDIGANICYRYENGVLTNIPLWPWPMADRIEKELGIDVMAELEQLFGPIPAECKGVGSKEDINLDGSVNSMDVQLCANVLIGWEMDADIVKRADVNDDGVVNTSDVRQIVNRYLEGM